MAAIAPASQAIGTAFATLLLIALLIGVQSLCLYSAAVRLPVLPKLGVVGNSAIMNVKPVFALVLAWLMLGQVGARWSWWGR